MLPGYTCILVVGTVMVLLPGNVTWLYMHSGSWHSYGTFTWLYTHNGSWHSYGTFTWLYTHTGSWHSYGAATWMCVYMQTSKLE